MHSWNDCPQNHWGPNKGKSYNAEGSLSMCTLGEFDTYAEFSPDDMMVMANDSFTDDNVHDDVGTVIKDNNNNHTVMIYPHRLKKNIRRLTRNIFKFMLINTNNRPRNRYVSYITQASVRYRPSMVDMMKVS